MATTNYITPIMDRTQLDVEYAKVNQDDLINKNKGSWNYTDANRVCNNLKYAAEWMYEQGFLLKPYSMQIKLDWKETDIITQEQFNSMIIDNMNNLYTYSRPDLEWYPITSITNMDYVLANWLEKNINALATQEPLPPDKFTLTVNDGTGSGEYEANTIVEIQANSPEEGMIFDHWSGDHLENIKSATASITTYKMPNQDITLQANYTSAVPHKLTIKTYSGTQVVNLSMGEVYKFTADPASAPEDNKVFHHWIVTPNDYEKNLDEQAATTFFTMPNEEVTLTAVYITNGKKQLIIHNGQGSGWYEYDSYVSISSNKSANEEFTSWTGDTQYLTGDAIQEFNSVKIPDKVKIELWAHYSARPATNVLLKVVDGIITNDGLYGETEGRFTQGDRVFIAPYVAPTGKIFANWQLSGGGEILNNKSSNGTVVIGATEATVTATYRKLEYHDLTVNTHSGTRHEVLESYDYFSVNANPAPDGYTFDKWIGDTNSFNTTAWGANVFYTNQAETGTCMGTSDRTITATYRPINSHTLTVKQLSGDVTYTEAEFKTLRVTAEDAPTGKRFVRWDLSGAGKLNTANTSKTVIYEFGNGDCTLTPIYVNVWTIIIEDGSINGQQNVVLDEGSTYDLHVRSLLSFEGFNGWTLDGLGTIQNLATPSTRFTVGAGNAKITANIILYPDKTLTIYYRDPDTNVDTLISQNTYTYGSYIPLVAPTAPKHTTFQSWEGDYEIIDAPLASSTSIKSLTTDTTIIATYYYPESPNYYTLTVYDGYPNPPSDYAVGSQITIRPKEPNQGWEFYKWYGDTQFLVNPDLSQSENAVIMPGHSITLYAKFKVIGELPLYRVSVTEGTVKGTYEDEDGNIHEEGADGQAVYIDVPTGTEVTLTANPNIVGYVFDHWEGNFPQTGVTDIVTTVTPTTFTMPEADMNIEMIRREQKKCMIYPTHMTGLIGQVYPNTYNIHAYLPNTEDYHYEFQKWICTDADGNNCIELIESPNEPNTKITITEDYTSLWIEAVFKTRYKLIVIKGQNTDTTQYYAEGEKVTTIIADTPEDNLIFNGWDDPMGVIENIYDPTPIITMKNTVVTITATYVSTDIAGNSIVATGNDLHNNIITRRQSTLINGIFAIGTIVFDKDGCIGIIKEEDPDKNDNTDDYRTEKLFYGGNF